ncbi:MAG: hypothetical protein SchgKO_10400 [Schleiferiaceae bacterium]
MDLGENKTIRTDFVERIRKDLIPLMESMGYALTFDNKSLSKSDRNRMIFKLVFEGPHRVEISNDDWKDYTEHFNFYVDSMKIFTACVIDYETADKAYFLCQRSLVRNLR